jgi:hypothetical protein
MHLLCLSVDRQQEAEEVAAEVAAMKEKGGEETKGGAEEVVMNVSGVWEADPTGGLGENTGPEACEAHLKHSKCPWVFRKVLKRAARLIKNITLTQREDTFTFAFTLHLFGTTENEVRYGELCDDTNMWDCPVKMKMDRPTKEFVHYQQLENPGIPEDSYDRSDMWLEDDGDRMIMESKLYRPDLGTETTYRQEFLRKGSALQLRVVGGGGGHK